MKDMLLERSHGWRKLYDPSVGFLRGKNADGSFPQARSIRLIWLDDYAEANAWQSLFDGGDPRSRRHRRDPRWPRRGDREAHRVVRRSRRTTGTSPTSRPRTFRAATTGQATSPTSTRRSCSRQLGRPDLTHEWARWVDRHDVLGPAERRPGNDDGGTMGAWYVLSTLGLYPIAGSDQLDHRRAAVSRVRGSRSAGKELRHRPTASVITRVTSRVSSSMAWRSTWLSSRMPSSRGRRSCTSR